MCSMLVTHYNAASSNNENNREISLNRYIKSSILTLGARCALSFVFDERNVTLQNFSLCLEVNKSLPIPGHQKEDSI